MRRRLGTAYCLQIWWLGWLAMPCPACWCSGENPQVGPYHAKLLAMLRNAACLHAEREGTPRHPVQNGYKHGIKICKSQWMLQSPQDWIGEDFTKLSIAGHLKDEGVKSGKRGYGLRATGAAVCLVLLLAWYSWRTFDRNWDWEDEERLFRSALKVQSFLSLHFSYRPILNELCSRHISRAQPALPLSNLTEIKPLSS